MSIKFVCKCGKQYTVESSLAGKVAQCARCKEQMTIPVLIEDKTTRIIASLEKSPNRWPPGLKEVIEEEHQLKQQQKQSTEINFSPASDPSPDEKSWYVYTADGNQYGPATKTELDEWVRIGSVTETCQIYGPGQTSWQPAQSLYPNLEPQHARTTTTDPGGPQGTAASAVEQAASEFHSDSQAEPATKTSSSSSQTRFKGGDEVASARIPPEERLLTLSDSESPIGSAAIRKESRKITECLLLNDRVYRVGSQLNYRKRLNSGTMVSSTKFKIVDQVHVFHFRIPVCEFLVILPFDNGVIAPVEFVAKMSGRLSDPIAMVKCQDQNIAMDPVAFSSEDIKDAIGQLAPKQQTLWIGCDGNVPEIATQAQKNTKLAKGLNWDGAIKIGANKTEYSLQWGVQAVPVDDSNYLLAAQNVPKQKMVGLNFATAWFAECCRVFDQFIGDIECQKTGKTDYIDPGVWFSAASEVTDWIRPSRTSG